MALIGPGVASCAARPGAKRPVSAKRVMSVSSGIRIALCRIEVPFIKRVSFRAPARNLVDSANAVSRRDPLFLGMTRRGIATVDSGRGVLAL